MTIATIRSPDESARTMVGSGSPFIPDGASFAGSSPNVTFFKNVNDLDEPAPREGFVDTDDLLEEFDCDPALLPLMAAARQQVAAQMRSVGKSPLAELRLRAGLSQRQLAREMETSQSYIARIEGNGGDLVLSTIERLASALQADLFQVIDAIRDLRRP